MSSMPAEKHLFFLIHGLFGNPEHMRTTAKVLEAKLDQNDVVVHVAASNKSVNTFDGVEVGGERLLRELVATISRLQTEEGYRVTKISIIGYSLGGLLSRYLIGMLEDAGFFEEIEPVIFTSFASPHVGSKYYSSKPRAVLLNFFGNALLGLTGQDLFQSSGLLSEMADPKKKYYRGLARFKHRVLFANTSNDRTVPFWTSYISRKNPFRQTRALDLRLYDHTKITAREGKKISAMGKAPFIIDMASTKFIGADANEDHKLSWRRLKNHLVTAISIPVFIPILLVVLASITGTAWVKYFLLRSKIRDNHKTLVKKLLENKSRLDKDPNEFTGDKLVQASAHPHNEDHASAGDDAAGAAGVAFDEVMEGVANVDSDRDSESVNAVEEPIGPQPALGDGYSGVIDSTPHELRLDDDAKQQIDNLNSLQWQKFAIRIKSYYSHGEIVDRLHRDREGVQLQKFYAYYVNELLDTKKTREANTVLAKDAPSSAPSGAGKPVL